MGSITKRKKSDGSVSYTAQIRIKKGSIKHSESLTSDDKKMLQKWLVLRESELKRDGVLEAMREDRVTVKDVLEWYEHDFSGATKFGRTKLSAVKYLQSCPGFDDCDAVNLKPSDLIAHARRRAEGGTGPATINTDFVWLRNAFRSARLVRDVPVNLQAVDDAANLLRKEKIIAKAKRRNRRPTLKELDELLVYFSERDGRATLPMVDITLFALFSGRRQEEICRICWDDLDYRRGGVLVRKMKHPTEKVDTFVYLTTEAMRIVERQPRVDECIFPYKSKSISSAFTRDSRVVGINDLRFHDLRHECVSWLFELGWDIPRVSRVSGHRSWATLQRYTHIQQHEPYNKYKNWKWLK